MVSRREIRHHPLHELAFVDAAVMVGVRQGELLDGQDLHRLAGLQVSVLVLVEADKAVPMKVSYSERSIVLLVFASSRSIWP